MKRTISAIHENGVLRPTEPLGLAERQEVTITVETDEPANDKWLDTDALEMARETLRRNTRPIPSLEEVRKIIGRDPSSWAEMVIEERGEY